MTRSIHEPSEEDTMTDTPTIDNPQVSLGTDEQGTQRFEIRVGDPADPVGFTVAIDHDAADHRAMA